MTNFWGQSHIFETSRVRSQFSHLTDNCPLNSTVSFNLIIIGQVCECVISPKYYICIVYHNCYLFQCGNVFVFAWLYFYAPPDFVRDHATCQIGYTTPRYMLARGQRFWTIRHLLFTFTTKVNGHKLIAECGPIYARYEFTEAWRFPWMHCKWFPCQNQVLLFRWQTEMIRLKKLLLLRERRQQQQLSSAP